MAIKLNAAYSKKLGLPGFSSHSFLVSAEVELTDLGQVQHEASRLYMLLQQAVDQQMQQPGFVPDEVYGLEGHGTPHQPLRNGNGNGHSYGRSNGAPSRPPDEGGWRCTDKQQELILRLVEEHRLDRHDVDELAHERFGLGVRQLNKLQASGLIDELIEKHGSRGRNGSTGGRGRTSTGGRRGAVT